MPDTRLTQLVMPAKLYVLLLNTWMELALAKIAKPPVPGTNTNLYLVVEPATGLVLIAHHSPTVLPAPVMPQETLVLSVMQATI